MASFNPRGDRSFIHAILSFVALPLLPGMEGGIFLARNWRGSVPRTTKRRENRGEAIYIFPWMARTRARVSTRASSMPRREETAGVGPYTHKRRNAILIIGSDYLRPTRLAHQLRVSFNFSHFEHPRQRLSVFERCPCQLSRNNTNGHLCPFIFERGGARIAPINTSNLVSRGRTLPEDGG